MAEFAWLFVGVLLGGCICTAILCCIQVNCTARYEQEIRKLRRQLDNKE